MHTARRRSAFWLGLVVAGSTAWAADAPGPATLGPSEDGAYVLDVRAQVAWPRCVQGMQWNGKTCLGKPLLLNHGEAMALARDPGKEGSREGGLQWRVPRVPQLQGLVRQATRPSGLDPALFPASPGGWHWSATTSVDTERVNPYDYNNIAKGRTEQNVNHMKFLHGWAVDLSSGEARGDVSKRTKLPVRLMLPLD